MSFSVAKQPSTDMKQLMTSGRTGMGDIISGFLANWFLPDRNHVCSYCDAASLRAGDGLADCDHRGTRNISSHHFRTKGVSVIPRSKKNPQVYKSSSHSGNPYHLSLRLVNFISSALPGCLNSTSDISSTVKSYNLQQDGTSDWGFQNKTLLAHNVSLSNPFLTLK